MAISPSAVLRCKDGFIGVAAVNDRQFQGLCTAMNRPEMAQAERFATFSSRVGEENAEALPLTRPLSDSGGFQSMRISKKLAHELHGICRTSVERRALS